MNFPPLQWETPPFLPEHGLFAALAGTAATTTMAAKVTAEMIVRSKTPSEKCNVEDAI